MQHNQRDTPAQQQALLYWVLLHYTDARSSVVIMDARGGLFEQFAQAAQRSVFRIPSQSLLEKFGLWIEPTFEHAEVISGEAPAQLSGVLAAEEGWLEYQNTVCAGGGQTPFHKVRCFRYDSVLSGLRQVSLFFVNEPDKARLSELLSGSTHFFSQQRPVVVLSSVRDVADVEAWCQQMDYCLLDRRLLERDLEIAVSDCLWVLMPAEQCDALVKVAHHAFLMHRVHRLGSVVDDLDSDAFVDLSSFDSPLLQNSVIEDSWFLSLPDLTTKNVYDLEQDADVSWCWSGPEKNISVLCPLPVSGRYHLELPVLWSARESTGVGRHLFVDGVLVREGHCVLDVEQKRGEATDVSGWCLVTLCLSETVQLSSDDPRFLGVALSPSLQLRSVRNNEKTYPYC